MAALDDVLLKEVLEARLRQPCLVANHDLIEQEQDLETKGMHRPHLQARQYLEHQPPGNTRESWQKCRELVDKYDKGVCDAFREQLDTLLVFAGLFSAVVTAFTVESYQWLHDDAADASVLLLAQIVNALNGTGSPLPVPSTSPVSAVSATRINIYWFLSLTLSLSAALVGILAKQWIREYDRDAGRTHQEAIGVRQMKFNGLDVWRVSDIVASVPLLLQTALALFFVGTGELLWQLNPSIAIPVTIVTTLALCFYLLTTALPAIQFAFWCHTPGSAAAQCPYKSPQSWLVVRSMLWLTAISRPRRFRELRGELFWDHSLNEVRTAGESIQRSSSWLAFDLAWTSVCDTTVDRAAYSFEALAWLRKMVDHPDLLTWLWHCIFETWTKSTHCAQENIQVCMHPTDRANIPAPPNMAFFKYRPDKLIHELLLPYAAAALMPLPTIVEMLYRSFNNGWGLDCHEVDSWFTGWISRMLERSNEGLPDDLCDSLVYVTSKMATRSQGSPEFGDLLHGIMWLLPGGGKVTSQQRTKLYLAVCTLSRRWMQTEDSHLAEGQRDFRTSRGWTLLACAMSHLSRPHSDPPLDYQPEDGPPYSLTTLVLSQLARAIDEAWRRLPPGPSTGDPLWKDDDREAAFYRLVEIAAFEESTESLWEDAVPLPQPQACGGASDTAAHPGMVPHEHAAPHTQERGDPQPQARSSNLLRGPGADAMAASHRQERDISAVDRAPAAQPPRGACVDGPSQRCGARPSDVEAPLCCTAESSHPGTEYARLAVATEGEDVHKNDVARTERTGAAQAAPTCDCIARAVVAHETS